MTVGWSPKWPLFFTKMIVIWTNHQNDRCSSDQYYRSFWLKIIPKWWVIIKMTVILPPKWPMFMFERLHRYRGLNVLATSQATNIKNQSPTISNELAQTGGRDRVSAKRTPSGGIRIFTHHALDFSPLIPNWCLKNVYDVIRLTFSSSSAETLHC